MKYLKIIFIATFLITGFSTVSAQDTEKSAKIATAEVPAKVKKALKNYSGYKIEEEASLIKRKGSPTVYAFKVKRKSWSYTLLIDKKGKVVGINEGERNN
ncbi:MAG: hypothetical protein QNJ57_11090 [Flavobacteriaceae bacterium]|nr:hypothetical protein [Flavobacteriaceae bacterium]